MRHCNVGDDLLETLGQKRLRQDRVGTSLERQCQGSDIVRHHDHGGVRESALQDFADLEAVDERQIHFGDHYRGTGTLQERNREIGIRGRTD